MKRILILGVVLTVFITSASAQDRGDKVRRHRIEKGFENGSINRVEKFRLQKDRSKYRMEKRKATRDGRISPYEKRKLNKMKRSDSRKIHRMKHNSHRRLV